MMQTVEDKVSLNAAYAQLRAIQRMSFANRGTPMRLRRGKAREFGPASRTSFHELRHAVQKGYVYAA